MVHDEPTLAVPTPPTQAPRPTTNLLRRVAVVQGAYFVLTGIWPLFGINSFQAVTGAKTDLWLVYTVGCLVAVIGTALLVAAAKRRLTPEVVILGIGSAVALAGIDVIFVLRGVISWVYLLDAVAQGVLIAWWVGAYVGPDEPAAARPYTHVQRLLNRGRSVTPTPPVR
jgi:hypothetical protein